MFLTKRKHAEDYKKELDGFRSEFTQLQRERQQQNHERNLLIRK